jgi:hypothetical protein
MSSPRGTGQGRPRVGQYRGEGAAVMDAAEPTGEGGAACSSTARPPARARGARGGRRSSQHTPFLWPGRRREGGLRRQICGPEEHGSGRRGREPAAEEQGGGVGAAEDEVAGGGGVAGAPWEETGAGGEETGAGWEQEGETTAGGSKRERGRRAGHHQPPATDLRTTAEGEKGSRRRRKKEEVWARPETSWPGEEWPKEAQRGETGAVWWQQGAGGEREEDLGGGG